MTASHDAHQVASRAVRSGLRRRVRAGIHHPLTSLASKSAVAAGVALWLGGFLPGQLAQYRYYAALGAFSVIYPALADTLRESARALSAIAVGAAIAVVVQLAVGANPVTVAVAVGAGVAVGGLSWFRAQRSWIPVAALFVLTVGGSNPETYVLGYLTQLLLGAVTGLVANFVLFPPLPVHELEAAAVSLRTQLVDQLRSVSRALDEDDPAAAHRALESLPELTPARDRMQAAIAEARRARRGNPRARRATPVHRALFDLGESLQRCSASVEAVGVVMIAQDEEPLGREVRRATARVLDAVAGVLESPQEVRPGSPKLDRAQASIEALLDAVEAGDFRSRESRYTAGAAAISARRCLSAFVTAYRRSGPAAEGPLPA